MDCQTGVFTLSATMGRMDNLLSEQAPPKVDLFDLNKSDFEAFLNTSDFYKHVTFYELEDPEDSEGDRCYSGDLPVNMLVIIYEICKNFRSKTSQEKRGIIRLLRDYLAFYDTCCFLFHSSKFGKTRGILLNTLQRYMREEKDPRVGKKLLCLYDEVNNVHINHMEVFAGANGFTQQETVSELVGLRSTFDTTTRKKMQVVLDKIEQECDVIAPRL